MTIALYAEKIAENTRKIEQLKANSMSEDDIVFYDKQDSNDDDDNA